MNGVAGISNPPKIWYDRSMDIDLTGFSTSQQQALFDLLILSMYADGHLTTAKDEHLQGLLDSMGHGEDSDRQSEFDTVVNRMRPSVQSIHKAKTKAALFAGAFTKRSQQKRVYAAIQDIMTADRHVSTWECTLLSELRLKFRL
jgi:hypothetical protein